MEEEVNISAIQKAEIMEEEYPEGRQDIFEQFLRDLQDNQMEVEEEVRNSHSQSSSRPNRRSDFRKILNSSSSNERLIPSSVKYSSSRQNSVGGQMKGQAENSLDSQSFRREFKKKFEQSFSISHTVRDSDSEFSQRSDSKSSRNIIVIPHVLEEEKRNEEEQKKIGCNCRRSKCLKLYCECFQKQMYCVATCNCRDCGNHPDNKQEHRQAIIEALARNAHSNSHGFEVEGVKAEDKAFSLVVGPEQVKKGCKCKKTKCLKKYCECFQSGVRCTVFCRCEGCFNNKQSPSDSQQFMHLIKQI